jgi:hypothetical protein
VPDERLPESVESTAYFVVAEALTNVAKYAGASHVQVRVGRRDSTVTVEVSDDGRGGPDPDRGSGLRGLRERLSALEGGSRWSRRPARGRRSGRRSRTAAVAGRHTLELGNVRRDNTARAIGRLARDAVDRSSADRGRRGLDRLGASVMLQPQRLAKLAR